MGEGLAVCRALENHLETQNCLMGLFRARSVTHQVKQAQMAFLECLFRRQRTTHSSLGRMDRGVDIRHLQGKENLILKKVPTAKYKLKIQFKEVQRAVAKGPSVLQCLRILQALKAHPKWLKAKVEEALKSTYSRTTIRTITLQSVNKSLQIQILTGMLATQTDLVLPQDLKDLDDGLSPKDLRTCLIRLQHPTQASTFQIGSQNRRQALLESKLPKAR